MSLLFSIGNKSNKNNDNDDDTSNNSSSSNNDDSRSYERREQKALQGISKSKLFCNLFMTWNQKKRVSAFCAFSQHPKTNIYERDFELDIFLPRMKEESFLELHRTCLFSFICGPASVSSKFEHDTTTIAQK